MKILKKGSAFDHVEHMVREHYGNHPLYETTTMILGYNVFTPVEFQQMFDEERLAGNRIVAYQLEQLYHGSPWLKKYCIDFLKMCDEVWDYDLGNIQFLTQTFGVKAKLRPMLFTNALKTITPVPYDACDIDFLFYGSLNKPRADMLGYIQRHVGRYKVTYLDNVWGKDLDSAIARSKVVLNLHYYPVGRQEQVRMFYPVINGKCVLSEKSETNFMGKSILDVEAEHVPQICLELVETGAWKKMAASAPVAYKELSDSYIARFR